jgi:hypothetical protein
MSSAEVAVVVSVDKKTRPISPLAGTLISAAQTIVEVIAVCDMLIVGVEVVTAQTTASGYAISPWPARIVGVGIVTAHATAVNIDWYSSLCFVMLRGVWKIEA